jgi:hypothetical protein
MDAALSQTDGDASDFLDRPAEQGWRDGPWSVRIVFGGVKAFACFRMAAIMAKASMTSEI